jgi:acetyl-CoA C-acetyltransferase
VAIRAALERSKLTNGDVDTVVMGNVIQAGNKMNPARQAAIQGGLPVNVPAMTVNRVCGSGAQAIASAAQEVMLGFAKSAIVAAWKTWIVLRTSWPRAGGDIAWAMLRFSTPC